MYLCMIDIVRIPLHGSYVPLTPISVVCRLFDRYPETKQKFKRLNTSSAEVMRKSARVRAHAGRVLVSLGSVIGSLEDAEMIDETIYLLGDSHNKRGITAEDFQVRQTDRKTIQRSSTMVKRLKQLVQL